MFITMRPVTKATYPNYKKLAAPLSVQPLVLKIPRQI